MATLLTALALGAVYYHRRLHLSRTAAPTVASGKPPRNATLALARPPWPSLPPVLRPPPHPSKHTPQQLPHQPKAPPPELLVPQPQNLSLRLRTVGRPLPAAPAVSAAPPPSAHHNHPPAKPRPTPVYKAVILQGWYPVSNVTVILHRLRQVLANFAAVLPAVWQFLVLYSPKCKFLTAHDLGVPTDRLRLEPSGKEFTPDNWFVAVNRFFKLKGFWRSLNADRVLLFQPDTVLCANSSHTIDDFLQWEYIGAPWHGAWFQEQRHLNDSRRTANWDVWQMWGGNGGLSLRSPAAMAACLTHFSPRTAYDWRLNEDKWFTRCLTKLRRRIAPWYVGRHFSSETYLDVGSLGYHKPLLQGKPPALVAQIVERCPEFRRLYEYLDAHHLWQDEKVKTGIWFPPAKSKTPTTPAKAPRGKE